jgi:hypothetical protein
MKIGKVALVLAAVAGVGALVLLRATLFRTPSEAEMIRKFRQHRAQFEQIRLMLQRDKNIETIGPDWVDTRYEGNGRWAALNVSADRIALYRARLKRLGFSRVDYYQGLVQLEQFGGGFADTTWGIGYMWSKNLPPALVRSAYRSKPMRGHRTYSVLDGNWYIYQRR